MAAGTSRAQHGLFYEPLTRGFARGRSPHLPLAERKLHFLARRRRRRLDHFKKPMTSMQLIKALFLPHFLLPLAYARKLKKQLLLYGETVTRTLKSYHAI